MSLLDFNEVKISNWIRKVYPPILCVVGLVGNALSVAVLCRERNRRTTTGVLLIALAASDIVVLIFSVLFLWIASTFQVDLRTYSSGSCKFLTFVTYFTLQLSAWILVIVTAERVYSVTYPHKVKETITFKRVMIALASLIIVLFGLNSHIFYGLQLKISYVSNETICSVIDSHEHFMFKIWPWIDFCVVFATPAIVFVGGNIIIIMKLKSSNHYRRESMLENGQVLNSHIAGVRSRKVVSAFTNMAIILNMAFFVLTGPFAIFAIGQPYWFPIAEMTSARQAQLILTGTILLMLMYTNNAINFIIYILGGSKFRKDFVAIVYCCKEQHRFSSERSHLSSTKQSSLPITGSVTLRQSETSI